ncbi:membrane hypothetical protein [Candidatus Sulfopaludibacter sp. SbA3]|nr:membrane hypothetical protein [Candidatus Sulfopaludibacter sp. SbA3]
MSWLSRIGNALRSGRMDRDLADEMEFHAAARRDEMMRRGVPAEEADRAVRRRLGNSLALREDSREVKAVSWLDSLMRDLRFGSRMLRKNPAVTLAALVSLSLAIGSWTAAFSLIDALMLRPLPVSHPESLVYLAYQAGGPSGSIDTLGTFFSFRELQLLRDAARGQADVFSRSSQQQHPVTFDSAEPDRVRVEFVSGGALDILGIRPALGRLLMPSDDQHPHESPVAVLSYDFWMRRFGGNPAVLGRWFADGDDRFQVVGVLQQGFTGVEPGVRTDIWAPNMMFSREAFTNPGWSWTNILARMRPGASPERLRQMMQAAFEEQRRVEPKRLFPKLIVRSARSGPSSLRETFARPLWILAAVVGLVLLIACSNVANLFLARAAAREREMALRISIGAGRARLVQQALAESGILAGAACICGLLLARAAAPSLVNLLTPANNPAYLDLRAGLRLAGRRGIDDSLRAGAGTAGIRGVSRRCVEAWRGQTHAAQSHAASAGGGAGELQLHGVVCRRPAASFVSHPYHHGSGIHAYRCDSGRRRGEKAYRRRGAGIAAVARRGAANSRCARGRPLRICPARWQHLVDRYPAARQRAEDAIPPAGRFAGVLRHHENAAGGWPQFRRTGSGAEVALGSHQPGLCATVLPGRESRGKTLLAESRQLLRRKRGDRSGARRQVRSASSAGASYGVSPAVRFRRRAGGTDFCGPQTRARRNGARSRRHRSIGARFAPAPAIHGD